MTKKYQCHFTTSKSAKLESPCWAQAQIQWIDQYPWKSVQRPYTPQAQVRLLHSAQALLVRFDIWEKNIRAVYTQMNDPVCRDSCAEFFFCPTSTDARYLSFEINPLGALLIGLGTSGEDLSFLTDSREIFEVQTVCTEDFWQVAYTIPFAFIRKYFASVSGVMRGNFMKCADLSKTPHHGCWNKICTDIPRFHVPQYFGEIELMEPMAVKEGE